MDATNLATSNRCGSAPRLSSTQNSTLPSAPRMGDSVTSCTGAPAVSAAAATSSRTRRPDCWVPDDALSSTGLLPTCFELGLHQQNQLALVLDKPNQGAHHHAKRDERQISYEQRRRSADIARLYRPHVSALDVRHSRVAYQLLVKLAVSHIDCDHLPGATLQ